MPGLSPLATSEDPLFSSVSLTGLLQSLMMGTLLGDLLSFILGSLGPSSCLSLSLLRSAMRLGEGDRDTAGESA